MNDDEGDGDNDDVNNEPGVWSGFGSVSSQQWQSTPTIVHSRLPAALDTTLLLLFLSFLAFSPGALCTSEKVRHYLIIVRRGIGASPNNETNTYFTQLKFRNLLWGLGGIASLVSVSIGKFQNYSMSRLGSLGKARVTQYGSSSGDKVTKRGDPTIWSCSDQNIAAGPESHWEDITGQDKGHQIW